jgi:hypothetical protein
VIVDAISIGTIIRMIIGELTLQYQLAGFNVTPGLSVIAYNDSARDRMLGIQPFADLRKA